MAHLSLGARGIPHKGGPLNQALIPEPLSSSCKKKQSATGPSCFFSLAAFWPSPHPTPRLFQQSGQLADLNLNAIGTNQKPALPFAHDRLFAGRGWGVSTIPVSRQPVTVTQPLELSIPARWVHAPHVKTRARWPFLRVFLLCLVLGAPRHLGFHQDSSPRLPAGRRRGVLSWNRGWSLLGMPRGTGRGGQ